MNSHDRFLKAVSRHQIVLPLVLICVLFFIAAKTNGQAPAKAFTHADTLRGSVTPQRAWWDVNFYDLHVKINLKYSSISGDNQITCKVLKPKTEMEIDLVVQVGQYRKGIQYAGKGHAVTRQLQLKKACSYLEKNGLEHAGPFRSQSG